MSKFRKLMAAAALLFVSSSVFVACDDDPNQLGPIGINSIVTTAQTAYVQWTIVSGDYIDGYKIVLREGGRDGQIVDEVITLPKETNHTFENLKPNTVYTVSTQGQLTSKSGFSSADIAYREFMTAPYVTTTGVTSVVKPNTEVDTLGNIITVDRAWSTVKFSQIDAVNCGNYRVVLYQGSEQEVKAGKAKTIGTETVSRDENPAEGATFGPLSLSTTYTVATNAIANASCWFLGNADASYYNFTTPAQ